MHLRGNTRPRGPSSTAPAPVPLASKRVFPGPAWSLQRPVSPAAGPRQSQAVGAGVMHGEASLCSREFGGVHMQPIAPVEAATENSEAFGVRGSSQGSSPRPSNASSLLLSLVGWGVGASPGLESANASWGARVPRGTGGLSNGSVDVP